MKNKKPITREKMNRQGIINLVFSLIVWVLFMVKLKVFFK